ncbi:hypothetical protein [Vibrio sp. HN007]|uniref:hypothetical protein n=1 Tax=Vibrio iocasae TaxID=3098914 RepID=UPI0035D4056B
MSKREELLELLALYSHFKKYPRLTPWVGSKYPSGKKILIIGESHYLPEGVTYHHDIERWYAGNEEDLKNDVQSSCIHEDDKLNGIKYISTSGILRARSTDMPKEKRKKFSAKGHAIYRNIFSSLNSVCFQKDNYLDTIDHVAYYNYFQRPAEKTGGSINVTKMDKEVAEATLKYLLQSLKPDLVVVVSKKVGKAIKPHLSEHKHIVTAHPASVWWNRKTKKGTTGKSSFCQFLEKNY